MASLAVLAPSPLFRAGLAALAVTMGFEPVEEAAGVKEIRNRGRESRRPELILIALPHENSESAEMMQEISAWAPDAKVVFIAPALDALVLSACFAAGASGVLVENMSREGLKHSLRLVAAGEKVFPSELATLLTSGARMSGPIDARAELRGLNVTEREADVLRCVAHGESNSSIAKKLGFSEAEVATDIKNLMRKLRVSNRTQAALWAVARGLGEPVASYPGLANQATAANSTPHADIDADVSRVI
jgi:two-component system nitrate/nitrite response regulator NarL